jgi:large subunit ribosomal protein L7/L12
MSVAVEEILEKLKSLSLLEASELVKGIEETFGVSAAAPAGGMIMAAPAAGGGAVAPAEPVEEKTEFDVIIKDPGAKKIEVIKVIRQLTNLGLVEAKTMAETAGSKVLTAVAKDAAADAKKKLEEAGAAVEVA